MNIKIIIVLLIASVIVIYYLGFTIFLWCVLIGIIIAFLVLVYVVQRSTGRVDKFKKWRKKVWNKYEKLEAKFFKWIDKI